MIKSIRIDRRDWEKIYSKIKEDYPPSYHLLRSIQKEKLGFLNREEIYNYKYIFLDFYDEHKKTMFFLKYGHMISKIEESVK